MTKTMNFPPLDEEVAVFEKFCGKTKGEDALTWEEIRTALNAIRDALNEQAKKSVTYTSFQKYYDDMYKHMRNDVEPNDVFKSPSTSGQNFGFYKFQLHNLNNIHHPKVKGDETKYAGSLIMSKFLN